MHEKTDGRGDHLEDRLQDVEQLLRVIVVPIGPRRVVPCRGTGRAQQSCSCSSQSVHRKAKARILPPCTFPNCSTPWTSHQLRM